MNEWNDGDGLRCQIDVDAVLQYLRDRLSTRRGDIRRYMQREAITLAHQAMGGEIECEDTIRWLEDYRDRQIKKLLTREAARTVAPGGKPRLLAAAKPAPGDLLDQPLTAVPCKRRSRRLP